MVQIFDATWLTANISNLAIDQIKDSSGYIDIAGCTQRPKPCSEIDASLKWASNRIASINEGKAVLNGISIAVGVEEV